MHHPEMNFHLIELVFAVNTCKTAEKTYWLGRRDVHEHLFRCLSMFVKNYNLKKKNATFLGVWRRTYAKNRTFRILFINVYSVSYCSIWYHESANIRTLSERDAGIFDFAELIRVGFSIQLFSVSAVACNNCCFPWVCVLLIILKCVFVSVYVRPSTKQIVRVHAHPY